MVVGGADTRCGRGKLPGSEAKVALSLRNGIIQQETLAHPRAAVNDLAGADLMSRQTEAT
jgi:hypothetical protein